MLEALTPDDILNRAEFFGRQRPMQDRLVSVVFANPSSPVWEDLHTNRAFLDERSGDEWDLFFAGMSAYGSMPGEREPVKLREIDRNVWLYLNPSHFGEIEHWILRGQGEAPRDVTERREPWRYSGGTDLVTFMVYARDPDWPSLVSVALYAPDGSGLDLSRITEGLRQWQDDDVDSSLAPGEAPRTEPLIRLSTALRWSALAISIAAAKAASAGVIGNAAYALLKQASGN
jgi:hypothetical protein